MGLVLPISFKQSRTGDTIPTDGLELWLDANVGITKDANGVSAWASRAGSDTAVQNNNTLKPTWAADTGDGHPGVLFDGVADFMSVPWRVGLANLPGLTRFNIFKIDGGFRLNQMGDGSGITTDSDYFGSDSIPLSVTRCFASAFLPAVPNDTGVLSYTSGRFDGTYIDQWFNGGKLTPTNVTNGTIEGDRLNTQYSGSQVNRGGLNLGRRNDASGGYSSGYLLETIQYNRALSDAEIAEVHAYLSSKFSI